MYLKCHKKWIKRVFVAGRAAALVPVLCCAAEIITVQPGRAVRAGPSSSRHQAAVVCSRTMTSPSPPLSPPTSPS